MEDADESPLNKANSGLGIREDAWLKELVLRWCTGPSATEERPKKVAFDAVIGVLGVLCP